MDINGNLNNMEMKWYPVDGQFKPEGEVLAKNISNDVMIGYIYYEEGYQIYICEDNYQSLKDITHFIPVSELIINIEEKK